MSEQAGKIVVVMPVFNDWAAFTRLLAEFDQIRDALPCNLYLIAVDDGSSERPDLAAIQAVRHPFQEIRIVPLACNLGHQRAIAVGLVIADRMDCVDMVIVMDSDGEDRPSDIPSLIAMQRTHPEHVIVARRGLRTEGRIFRCCYAIYRRIFRLLTGGTIDFGNFCVLPPNALQGLTYNPASWNNLAAALSRSRLPILKHKVDRGVRLGGVSRMNFTSLIIHGLSAISVYADVVIVRVIMAASTAALVALVGLVAVIAIRLFTDLAIPGWASYVAASLIVVLFQAALLGGLAVFQMLNARSVKPFVPAIDAMAFVLSSRAGRTGTAAVPAFETERDRPIHPKSAAK